MSCIPLAEISIGMLLPWTSNKNKLPRRGRGGSSWYPPYGDCEMGYSSLSLHHKACGVSTESPVSYEMEYKEPPTLPYDIYCLVVDVLAADDSDPRSRYRSLRSCALTSSAWLSRAHFHLYRKVVLRTRHALLSFVRTITDSPQHFAPLVEHIEVKVSPAHAVHNWPMDHRQVTFPVPAAAIAQMAKLQSARFVGSFQFAETPASLVALVRAFTACGALRKVALHTFFIPQFRELVATLWAFPHMASLSLVECGWCTPRSGLEIPDANAFPARCHSLDKLLVGPLVVLRCLRSSKAHDLRFVSTGI